MTLDDLEFELRKLPGVRAAGFDDRGDVLMVQLHLAADRSTTDDHDIPLPVAATRIATRYSDRPVAVEVVRWRDAPESAEPDNNVTPIGPSLIPHEGPTGQVDPHADADADDERRPRLLAVLSFPDTDELEVHLVHNGRRTIGRSPASAGLVGAAHATIDAIRSLGVELDALAQWAKQIDAADAILVMVAVSAPSESGTHTFYGASAGTSPIDATARGTLDALNRQIARLLPNE